MVEFSIAQGLEVQEQGLLLWKSVLKDEAYNHLCEVVNKRNALYMRDGFDVLRGVMLDEIVTRHAWVLTYGKIEF